MNESESEMNENPEIPEYILRKIRQRDGLEGDDTSQDDRILKMSPIRKLRKVMGWELGDGHWADQVLEWARGCGFKIPEE